MKKLSVFLIFCLLVVQSVYQYESVYADELDDIEKKLAELSKARTDSVNATKPLEGRMDQLSATLKSVQNSIVKVEGEISKKEKELAKLQASIHESEGRLNEITDVFENKVGSYYMNAQSASPILLVLSSDSIGSFTRKMAYRAATLEEDQRFIKGVGAEIRALNGDKDTAENLKKDLEVESTRLVSIKKKTAEEAKFYEGEIAKAKKYQTELSTQIASLSARQQALLAEKTGSFTSSVGEVPLTDDAASSPSYNPGFSPAFAAFSFGAPHRKGMSQYGALGRARSGQNYETILKAYYGNVRIEKRDLPSTIATSQGSMSFEDQYLKGIAEMPSGWDLEAQKAQAIAARTYAMVAGKPICITESCQVYNASKVSNGAASKWHQAVSETKGMVVVSNSSNDMITTYYASTSGGAIYGYSGRGHSTPQIWDTKCGSQSCWTGDAYEKIANSPWFYKGWYKPRGGGGSRKHPWLNSSEMADIVNAALVVKKDGNNVTHVSQTDKSNGDTWSVDRLKQELGGDAVNSVSGTESTKYANGGYTSEVTFITDKGTIRLSGDLFKQVFNLRAPGELFLQSALYNIEKK
jgi:peptidoglycan hydrolase-like amidase